MNVFGYISLYVTVSLTQLPFHTQEWFPRFCFRFENSVQWMHACIYKCSAYARWNAIDLTHMVCPSPCMIMHSMRNLSWFPIPAAQELRYVEFFAGKGEVFSAVRAGGTPAMAVDIEYMTGRDHAFDINSVSGLPFLCCTSLKSHIYWFHVLFQNRSFKPHRWALRCQNISCIYIQWHMLEQKLSLTHAMHVRIWN